jgi:hypothetical protein
MTIRFTIFPENFQSAWQKFRHFYHNYSEFATVVIFSSEKKDGEVIIMSQET